MRCVQFCLLGIDLLRRVFSRRRNRKYLKCPSYQQATNIGNSLVMKMFGWSNWEIIMSLDLNLISYKQFQRSTCLEYNLYLRQFNNRKWKRCTLFNQVQPCSSKSIYVAVKQTQNFQDQFSLCCISLYYYPIQHSNEKIAWEGFFFFFFK